MNLEGNNMAKTQKNSQRISLMLPEAAANRLKKLKDVSEASSNTDVIRSALRMYEWMIEEFQKGNALYVKQPDGVEKPVSLFAVQ